MPSKWDTSGVDWLDVRNSRTSIVLYELSQATAELYSVAYRETVTTGSYSIPPNYSTINFKRRQESCLVYIIDKLKRMFAEDESYFQSDGRPLGTKCFISDTEDPDIFPSNSFVNSAESTRYDNYAAGVPTLDTSIGGELELNCGDLSFLRAVDFRGRISHEILQTIYNILTYPKKTISTPFVNNEPYGYNIKMPRVSRFLGRSTVSFEINGGRGLNSNVNTAITRMYSNDDGVSLGQNDSYLVREFSLNDNQSSSTAINATCDNWTGTNFRNAINNNSIDIADVRYDSIKWSVVKNSSSTANFGLYPSDSPFPVNTNRINSIPIIFANNGFLGDQYWLDTKSNPINGGIPTLSTGVGFNRQEIIYEIGMVLVKIDIPGVMDYYTAP